MPDSNSLKLYAVLLGGRAKGCNIELHDVQFVISTSIENAYVDLLDKWFGLPDRLHIDSYISLDVVDGYEISVQKEKVDQEEKLYFVNMGAYEDGKFTELHETALLVDSSADAVKKRAKESLLQGKESLHTDDLFDVDDCISVDKVDDWYIRLNPTTELENLIPINGYHPLPKKVISDYLLKNPEKDS